MTLNETPRIAQDSASWFTQLWNLLISAHPSVQEVGEKRRAQLLATLTLILTLIYIWALISRPDSSGSFVALLSFTIIVYAISRTPYYRIGNYLFSFGFTAFAFIL